MPPSRALVNNEYKLSQPEWKLGLPIPFPMLITIVPLPHLLQFTVLITCKKMKIIIILFKFVRWSVKKMKDLCNHGLIVKAAAPDKQLKKRDASSDVSRGFVFIPHPFCFIMTVWDLQ